MVDKEAIAVGDTPNPQAAGGDQSKISEKSVWELFLQVARRQPIVTSLAGLFIGTATATLFGFPVGRAWEFLLILTLIVAIVGILLAYLRRRPKTSAMNIANQDGTAQQATVSRQGFWHSWWPLIIVFCVGGMIKPWLNEEENKPNARFLPRRDGRPATPINPQAFALQGSADVKKRASQTADYWSKCVAALHAVRFAVPPEDSQESASGYDQRLLANAEQALKVARSTPTLFVDRDLVAMAEAHMQFDEQLIKLVHQAQQFVADNGNQPRNETLQDRAEDEAALWDKLQNWTEEEITALPEQIPQVVIALRKLTETREMQFREIEIMQGRLTERYRGQSFSLPEIASESE